MSAQHSQFARLQRSTCGYVCGGFEIQRGQHGAGPKIIENEQTNRGRQIALLAIAVDLADQFGQRHVAQPGDFLHAVPECLFEADAGLVTRDHDRAFLPLAIS